jgi:hypothetical protein
MALIPSAVTPLLLLKLKELTFESPADIEALRCSITKYKFWQIAS